VFKTVAVAGFALSLTLSGFAQSGDLRALVDAYRRNGRPEVAQLMSQPRPAVQSTADAALSDPAWKWDELRAAAMLYAEAAVEAQRKKDSGAADFYLTIGQKFIERTYSVERTQASFAARWYGTVAQLVDLYGGRGLAKRLADYAQSKWPQSSAQASLRRGLQLEARGARDGAVLEPGQSTVFKGVELQSTWFVPAAEAFGDAIKGDPGRGAAAVHLGRLRMLERKRDEAAALFRTALDDDEPAVAYMAALFLGSLEEREEHYDAAEKLYRQAIARFPYGQSAPLALAELLSRSGRAADASAALAVLRPGFRAIEPLWVYCAMPDEELGTRFDLLRAEVWK